MEGLLLRMWNLTSFWCWWNGEKNLDSISPGPRRKGFSSGCEICLVFCAGEKKLDSISPGPRHIGLFIRMKNLPSFMSRLKKNWQQFPWTRHKSVRLFKISSRCEIWLVLWASEKIIGFLNFPCYSFIKILTRGGYMYNHNNLPIRAYYIRIRKRFTI